MPRIKYGLEPLPKPRVSTVLPELVDELKSDREFGQPVIEEQHFPKSDAIRVTVLWDKWDSVPDEERHATILQAYEEAEGEAVRDRIALAIGLTFPEAYESGLLPYQVIPLLRRDDVVDAEECRRAMKEQGASPLLDPEKPQLRFATEAEAKACVGRLIARLPASEPIWSINREATWVAS